MLFKSKYMRLVIIFLCCFFPVYKISAQNTDSVTYIMAKIKTEWNSIKKEKFCSLEVEKGNPYATVLYSLSKYQNPSRQADAVYNNGNNNKNYPVSDKKINYFINATEVFNYLAQSGWYLDNVVTTVSTQPESDSGVNGTFYYPNTTSETFYIFKKILK